MDGSRFDAWTRRRFGMAAGGAAFAFFAETHADSVAKKKNKKKKKRCKRLLDPCRPGGKRKCCNVLSCLPTTLFGTDHRCCKKLDAPCASDEECCSQNCSSVLGCIPQE